MWSCLACLISFCVVCYAKPDCLQIESQLWKNVWSSEFNSENDLKKLWRIANDTCPENSESCNLEENVQIIDGYAFLQAKHKKYNGLNYTGSTLTSKQWSSYGRYEIRARLPRGDFVKAAIFTSTKNNNGEINIGT